MRHITVVIIMTLILASPTSSFAICYTPPDRIHLLQNGTPITSSDFFIAMKAQPTPPFYSPLRILSFCKDGICSIYLNKGDSRVPGECSFVQITNATIFNKVKNSNLIHLQYFSALPDGSFYVFHTNSPDESRTRDEEAFKLLFDEYSSFYKYSFINAGLFEGKIPSMFDCGYRGSNITYDIETKAFFIRDKTEEEVLEELRISDSRRDKYFWKQGNG